MDIRIVVERIGMVGKRQEVQIVHLGSVVKGLFHCTGTVGKIGMRMELAEIQRVITQIHRRFVGKGHNFAGLSLFLTCRRDIGNRFDNNRLSVSGVFSISMGAVYFWLFSVTSGSAGSVPSVDMV